MNLTGSLQIRRNKYYAVINAKDEYSKPDPQWLPTGIAAKTGNKTKDLKNKRNAEAILEKARYELRNQVTTNTLFADYLYVWLERKKNGIRRKLNYRTLESYENYIRKHIDPYFRKKNAKVSEVDEELIEGFYIHCLNNGRIDGEGGLSSSTVLKFKVPITGTLSLALRNKLILYNPASNAETPIAQNQSMITTRLKILIRYSSVLKEKRDFIISLK